MRKVFFFFFFFLTVSVFYSQNNYSAYISYIQKYYQLATEQQSKYAIPASITLAQGLLESGAGNGTLALKSNNHFGIKCKNWSGDKVYHDDDERGECFRKYNSVSESYEDHSLFLKNRTRYSSLFLLNSADYKGWAFGLKAAGYATDPNYAIKLIQLIDNYDLHQYDIGKSDNYYQNTYTKSKIEIAEFGKKREKNILEEYPHDLFINNRVKCVFSLAGDTYESIAAEFELDIKDILLFNDLSNSEILMPNTIIYIQKKKNKSSASYKIHTVQNGENLYRISQKYAIKLQKLYDLNKLSYNKTAEVGMKLKLR